MNFLFLMQTYINIADADAMYNSLVAEFVSHGHNVTVVASNEGRSKTRISIEGGVEVLRVNTLPLLNINAKIKGLANVLLPLNYRRAMRRHLSNMKFDYIITPTPPITLTYLARSIKRKHRAKLFLILRDIFPQNAIDLELFSKGSLIYKLFRKMEIDLYNVADYIGCMTPGNIDYVKRYNPTLDPTKLLLLPNWTKPGKTDSEAGKAIIKNLGLENKFIVIYGGNLGIAQRVENIVDLAAIHQEKEDLVFLVIGKGTHKPILENLIRERRIKNIALVDFLKRSQYESVVTLSIIGLASLSEKFTIPNVPYKILSYYNYKVPVFAVIDRSTDLNTMIDSDNSGLYCYQGDYEGYREKFDRLYYNPELRRELGNCGYNALMSKYTAGIAYNTITNIMGISNTATL